MEDVSLVGVERLNCLKREILDVDTDINNASLIMYLYIDVKTSFSVYHVVWNKVSSRFGQAFPKNFNTHSTWERS